MSETAKPKNSPEANEPEETKELNPEKVVQVGDAAQPTNGAGTTAVSESALSEVTAADDELSEARPAPELHTTSEEKENNAATPTPTESEAAETVVFPAPEKADRLAPADAAAQIDPATEVIDMPDRADLEVDVPDYDPYKATGRAAPRHIGAEPEPTQVLEPVALADVAALQAVEVDPDDAELAEVAEVAEEDNVEVVPAARRGTMDFGLLLLRLAVGSWLIWISAGVFLGDQVQQLQREFGIYPYGELLAYVIPGAQLLAGVTLVLGIATPLFAAIGSVAMAFLATHTALSVPPAIWPQLALEPLVVFSLIFTGPGFYSVDFSRSWSRRPLVSAFLFGLLAIGGMAALWFFVVAPVYTKLGII